MAASNPAKKYSILPLDEKFKFGVTGKMNAIVSNEKAATSALCNTSGMDPVMNVTTSAAEQLRFSVKTDLCKMTPNGRIEVVDKIDAEFVYAFGRRAYPATTAQDTITPELELYIDEYLKELVRRGVPLPSTVLMSDGSVPGDEDGDGAPDNAPNADPGTSPTEKSPGAGVCDCSCDQYRRIKKASENARRNPAEARKIMSMMACIKVCATEYSKCGK